MEWAEVSGNRGAVVHRCDYVKVQVVVAACVLWAETDRLHTEGWSLCTDEPLTF